VSGPLIVLGAAGTAADVVDIVFELNRAGSRYEILGLLDDDTRKHGQSFAGVPVLGPLTDAVRWPQARLVNALGSPRSYRSRAGLIARLGLPASRYVTLIHPGARISPTSSIGAGALVYPGVVICSGAAIGEHVTLLANTVINHDVHVGDFSIAASGVNVAGGVSIGESCYLGAGSTIIQGLIVGDEALVGAGSVVIRDVSAGSTVAGNPARLIKAAATLPDAPSAPIHDS
jgi:sugar O-acyltransferase (sialic acid O-acetyltransferase NeuD family)